MIWERRWVINPRYITHWSNREPYDKNIATITLWWAMSLMPLAVLCIVLSEFFYEDFFIKLWAIYAFLWLFICFISIFIKRREVLYNIESVIWLTIIWTAVRWRVVYEYDAIFWEPGLAFNFLFIGIYMLMIPFSKDFVNHMTVEEIYNTCLFCNEERDTIIDFNGWESYCICDECLDKECEAILCSSCNQYEEWGIEPREWEFVCSYCRD